jgi:hypothetical protein
MVIVVYDLRDPDAWQAARRPSPHLLPPHSLQRAIVTSTTALDLGVRHVSGLQRRLESRS